VEPVALETFVDQIERLGALDRVADALQKAVRTLVPQQSRLKDILSGTWLGHPLHPPLTDVVVGAWTSALLLDLFGGDAGEEAADRLVAVGAVAAVPTAASGLSDWAELRGGSRRVGTIHAAGNTTALMLHALSFSARKRGDRRRGIALSASGYAVATFSARLGGHLSFGKGVGVNQAAFEDGAVEWTPVLDETALEEGTLTAAHADGVGLVLVRKGERVFALADRCSHRGCSLHEGELRDDAVICPCHGSTFRLDGRILKGPATAPQRSFAVRTREGKVEVRQRNTAS
jgi:nitrite reductase/ring-hydroxylating ferredoxin subunit/uncharacterized membrane protein